MRCFGMPVLPPVSKMLKGRPWYLFGTQTSGCKSRSHSSWKCGKRSRSSNVFTSLAGFQPAFFAQSSQNGLPVSGEKCHFTISRVWASSCSWACLIASGETVLDMMAWFGLICRCDLLRLHGGRLIFGGGILGRVIEDVK